MRRLPHRFAYCGRRAFKAQAAAQPGHEIVGIVAGKGERVERYNIGHRLGVPWLAHTCGYCSYCLGGRENLCYHTHLAGYTVNGGYAESALAEQRYRFTLPQGYSDTEAAPLLCAGLIGYRALLADTGGSQSQFKKRYRGVRQYPHEYLCY